MPRCSVRGARLPSRCIANLSHQALCVRFNGSVVPAVFLQHLHRALLGILDSYCIDIIVFPKYLGFVPPGFYQSSPELCWCCVAAALQMDLANFAKKKQETSYRCFWGRPRECCHRILVTDQKPRQREAYLKGVGSLRLRTLRGLLTALTRPTLLA
jgi:hypothetical protein